MLNLVVKCLKRKKSSKLSVDNIELMRTATKEFENLSISTSGNESIKVLKVK